MASRKRNGKTHPGGAGKRSAAAAAADRPDQVGLNDGDELATETIDLGGAADGRVVDTGIQVPGRDGGGADDAGPGQRADDHSGDDQGGDDSARGDGAAADEDELARGDRAARGGHRASQRRGDRGRGSDDDPDDDRQFSRATRRRIAREQAVTNRERALREQAEAKLADERARAQAQEERIARLERATAEGATNATVRELEAQVAALKPQILAAMEAGESARVLDLQEKMADLYGKIGIAKAEAASRARHAEQAAAAAARDRAANEEKARQAGAHPADNPEIKRVSDEFIHANRHWWNRSKYKDAQEDAIRFDKEILKEIEKGEMDFEPYTDEHFEELARRVQHLYPNIEICDQYGDEYVFDEEQEEDDVTDRRNGSGGRSRNGNGSGNGRRAPMGGMGAGGRRNGEGNAIEDAKKGRVTLTDKDFKQMRIYGLDPSKPEDKKAFAKERMRTIITEARRAGEG